MYGQDAKASPSQRWDLGLLGGAVYYSDINGVEGALETRAYLVPYPYFLNAFLGCGGSIQYATNERHAMTDIYGYALGGIDWFFMKEVSPEVSEISLRAQLAAGGGYTSDTNSAGTIAGYGGFLFRPSLGIDLGFGSIHASFMAGYEMIRSGDVLRTAPSFSVGLSWSIVDRSVQ